MVQRPSAVRFLCQPAFAALQIDLVIPLYLHHGGGRIVRHLNIVVQTGLLEELDILVGILSQNLHHQPAAGGGVVYQKRFLQRDHRHLSARRHRYTPRQTSA